MDLTLNNILVCLVGVYPTPVLHYVTDAACTIQKSHIVFVLFCCGFEANNDTYHSCSILAEPTHLPLSSCSSFRLLTIAGLLTLDRSSPRVISVAKAVYVMAMWE